MNSKRDTTDNKTSAKVSKPAAKRQKGRAVRPSSVRRVKKVRTLLALMATGMVVVMVILFASLRLGDIGLSNIADAGSAMVSAFSPGKGYPSTYSGVNMLSVERIGNGLSVLERDAVFVLDSSAKRTLSEQHTYANPVMQTVNGRSIVYDRASGRFRVQSKTRILREGDMKANILTAVIGKNGYYAVATKAETAASELTVYNSRNVRVFKWECAGERVAALALSDNGRTVAVAVIGSAQAELYTKVFVFQLDSSEPMVSFEFPETVMVRVSFGSGNTLLAIGDNLVSVIDIQSASKRDTPYGADTLHRLSVHESGKTVIALSVFGNATRGRLLTLASDGQILFDLSADSEIRWVSCDKSYVCVLTVREVLRYNNKGDLVGNTPVGDEARRVISAGRYFYTVTQREIFRELTASG